ncbi:MAG: hypothetical protein IJX48_02055 [Paludibacteraceae bacterium]|nr:hypothetical protein [Paludibacteraceae bacterium]
MNRRKMTMLNIGLGICLAAEAVVYEPFAGVDNTLPSDKTFEENFGYKAEFSYPQLSSNQRTIGGGAAYYCPYCGAPLDPHDHTELVRHGGNGNAYDYTGRTHHCNMPLHGEETLLLFAAALLCTKIGTSLRRKKTAS